MSRKKPVFVSHSEVFKLIDKGMSARDVAEKLNLSVRTVHRYLQVRGRNKASWIKSRETGKAPKRVAKRRQGPVAAKPKGMTIGFTLVDGEQVTIRINDGTGRLIETLVVSTEGLIAKRPNKKLCGQRISFDVLERLSEIGLL